MSAPPPAPPPSLASTVAERTLRIEALEEALQGDLSVNGTFSEIPWRKRWIPPLLVAAATSEALPFARNWLCSIGTARVQASVMVVAFSDGVCEGLGPHLMAVNASCKASALQLTHRVTRDVTWRSPEYFAAVRSKIILFSEALEHAAVRRNAPSWVVFCDVDVVFHKDVSAYLRRGYPNASAPIFSLRSCNDRRINSGLFAMRPVNASLNFFALAQEYLLAGKSYDHTDMGAIQAAADTITRFHRLPCGEMLPGNMLGKVWRYHENIVGLHMNWVQRASMKMLCLNLTGQWLARAPPGVCASAFSPRVTRISGGSGSISCSGSHPLPMGSS